MTDVIISLVGEKVAALEEKIRHEVNLVRRVKEEILYLSDKLHTITNVLDDAEKRGVQEPSVKRWLKKLENTAYEMDDILDEWNYTLLKHEMEASAKSKLKQMIGCSFIPSPRLCFKKVSVRHDTAKKIENVKAKLNQILKEKDGFNFAISLPATDPAPSQTTSLIDLKKVHGSEIHKKKNDIVSKLLLNNTKILSIVGTGGLGKTTLAQLIFNDPRFDKGWSKIWICVSNPFVVADIAKKIVELVGSVEIPPMTTQEELIFQQLKATVKEKKFLLVLDDVWPKEEERWEPLKVALEDGAPGSKILVTTRDEDAASIMGTLKDDIYRPGKLSDVDCWSLLRDTSLPGKSDEEFKKFETVGKKIARKCNGLPLAAVFLGRLLRLKSLERWNQVERSEIWKLENVDVKLFPHLVLSYNDLSPILKRCFSYCAIYPKNCRIHAESLIEEWMALGYLGSVGGKDGVELKGREYLEILARRSFFQDIEESESGEEIEWCKMHDIVHDFALFIRKNDDNGERICQDCNSSLVSSVQEYRCLSWDHIPPADERERSLQDGYSYCCLSLGDTPPDDVRERSCRVCDCLKSLRVLRFKRGPPPVGMETLIHLRCLDFSGIALSNDDFKIICKLYFLQTLLLSLCTITRIPQEIGNLVQLRRLALSYNTLVELPESMYNLVDLQSLSLAYCSLEEIHSEIGNLVKLRKLDISSNKDITVLPESIGRLVELQILMIEGTDIRVSPQVVDQLSNLHTLESSRLPSRKSLQQVGVAGKVKPY